MEVWPWADKVTRGESVWSVGKGRGGTGGWVSIEEDRWEVSWEETSMKLEPRHREEGEAAVSTG